MHGVAVLTLGLLFSAPSLEDVNRAVKNVLADSRIQSEFPAEDEAPPRPEIRREYRERAPRREPGPVFGRSTFVSTLLWVVVGVGVLLIVVWLVRGLQGYARPVQVTETTVVVRPRAPPAEPALGDAEALATEGRYEEAVHLLLLHALRGVERDGAKVSSHTSREVVREAELEGESLDAVMGLIGAVELSLFGGRPIDDAGYRTSIDHYRKFRAARA